MDSCCSAIATPRVSSPATAQSGKPPICLWLFKCIYHTRSGGCQSTDWILLPFEVFSYLFKQKIQASSYSDAMLLPTSKINLVSITVPHFHPPKLLSPTPLVQQILFVSSFAEIKYLPHRRTVFNDKEKSFRSENVLFTHKMVHISFNSMVLKFLCYLVFS